jgi:hypothetical protein
MADPKQLTTVTIKSDNLLEVLPSKKATLPVSMKGEPAIDGIDSPEVTSGEVRTIVAEKAVAQEGKKVSASNVVKEDAHKSGEVTSTKGIRTTFIPERVSGGPRTATPIISAKSYDSATFVIAPSRAKQVSEALIHSLIDEGGKRERRDAMSPAEAAPAKDVDRGAVSFVPVGVRKGGGRGGR